MTTFRSESVCIGYPTARIATDARHKKTKPEKKMNPEISENKLSGVIGVVTADVLRKLSLVKAQYKIILPDGTEFGDLEIVRAKSGVKRVSTVPRGFYKDIYFPVVQGMQVGDVGEIPVPEGCKQPALLAAVSAWFCSKHGNGSAKTMFNTNTGRIEVLRML
jgi:hypothetical protein